ncbi:MAG: biotin transporter BioY [Clostridia bacterium]|nr:biotin transporter BioY [Clostridia bacterium]
MKKSALKISLTALASCWICLCSWIAIPLGGVPMTLQTFGVALCGFLLGARGGVCAAAVYLALGAVGLPVFAGFGGSLAFLAGPTGGFLVGFLFLSLFCGIASRKTSEKKLVFLLLAASGLLFCHLPGVFWFARVSGVSLAQAFWIASLPYLPKDAVSVFCAWTLCRKIRKRLPSHRF